MECRHYLSETSQNELLRIDRAGPKSVILQTQSRN